MSSNDDEIRAIVRAGADRVDTFLAHFGQPDATWDSFGKVSMYLEHLRLDLLTMLLHTEQELQRRLAASVEPTDYGV